ncbi:MAG: hypothetical protein ACJ72N_08730 [Labedaea sp.]
MTSATTRSVWPSGKGGWLLAGTLDADGAVLVVVAGGSVELTGGGTCVVVDGALV